MTADGESKSPLDQWVDWFVYAPVGLLYERDEVLERLVTRGRSQVQLARLMAKMASQKSGGTEAMVGEVVALAADVVAKSITEVGIALGLVPTPRGSTDTVDVDDVSHDASTDDGATPHADATGGPADAPGYAAQTPAPGEPPSQGSGPDAAPANAVDDPPSDLAGAEDEPGEPGPLPLADYDTLTARSVVVALDALTPAEVTVIADYERNGRNRKTILAKAERILGG